MGLRLLRSSIAMIPQEPVLIEGSVRENLDPFGRHSDEALLQAISKVGLGNSSTLGHGATVEGAEQDKEASGASPGESSGGSAGRKSSPREGGSLLDQEVGSGGENLSHGERQLLAVARVLLRKCKVYVMDEPTSNIDPSTDEKLQRVIRSSFDGATLVTIAHRLHTVADFDQVRPPVR